MEGGRLAYARIDRLKKELDTAISEGDFGLALEVVNDMIKIDHEKDQYWNSRGVILSKLGRVEESIEAFDQGLEMNPEGSRLWYSKGCVLMDSGKPRAALACFYKALDSEPGYEKARDRFIRCLEDLVLLKQARDQGVSDEQMMHNAPSGEMPGPSDEDDDDEEEDMPDILEPKATKKKGTYLEDEMFVEARDRKEDLEDMDEDWDDEEEEEEWEDEEGEEEQVWEDDDIEDTEEEIANYIVCRCGSRIDITSDERPYKFKCKNCGRTGNLKV